MGVLSNLHTGSAKHYRNPILELIDTSSRIYISLGRLDYHISESVLIT